MSSIRLEYLIVSASSAEHLARLVDGAIREGWEPQGGAAVDLCSQHYRFMQAMIRYTLPVCQDDK